LILRNKYIQMHGQQNVKKIVSAVSHFTEYLKFALADLTAKQTQLTQNFYL